MGGEKVPWYQLLEHVLPFPYTEEAVLYTVAEEGGGVWLRLGVSLVAFGGF